MGTEEKKTKSTDILCNPKLPVLFVDNLNVGRRGDGVYLLRLLSELPEGLVEQGKIVITENRLKVMIDLICLQANYYPVKPKSDSKK